MPKQIFQINDFSGGLNRDADPRDIADNESAILWGWNVDEKGVLKLGGGNGLPAYGPRRFRDDNDILDEEVYNAMSGYGLGTFAADYDPSSLTDMGISNEIRTEYILFAAPDSKIHIYASNETISDDTSQDSSITKYHDIISMGGRASHSDSAVNSKALVKYYTADGGIRIYDTDFSHKYNSNKSLIFVNRKFMQKSYFVGTSTELQTIGTIDQGNSKNFEVKRWVSGHAILDNEPPYDGSSHGWDSGYCDPLDAKRGVMARPVNTVGYHTHDEDHEALTKRFPDDVGSSGIGAGHTIDTLNGSGLGGKVCMEYMDNSGGTLEDGGMKKRWAMYYCFVYDENNLTTLQPITTPSGNNLTLNFSSLTHAKRYRVSFAMNPMADHIAMTTDNNDEDVRDLTLTNEGLFDTYTTKDLIWNPRITGFQIYMKEVQDDTTGGSSDHYLAFEADLQDGTFDAPVNPDASPGMRFICNTFGNNDPEISFIAHFYTPDPGEDANGDSYFAFKSLPPETFESRYGYDGSKPQYLKYKTACVLNRRTYIGNVATLDNEYYKMADKVYDDRMVKSPVNAFDTFPFDNFVDVAINDGDAIIHLEGFNDRILQFKEKILYIINVSQDFEFLESSHPHMGIKNHIQVCKTPFGIAWINDKGCYFYDGKGIKNLIDGKIKRGRPIEFKDGDRVLNDSEDDNSGKDQVIANSYISALFDDEGIIKYTIKDGFQDEDGKSGVQSKYHPYLGWGAFMNSMLENIQTNSDGWQRNSIPSIGYDAVSDKLIVLRNVSANGYDYSSSWVYAYNLKTQAWTCHPFAYFASTAGKNKTNFINNKKGELILYQTVVMEHTNQEPTPTTQKDACGFYKWSDSREPREMAYWTGGYDDDNNVLDNKLKDFIWYRTKDIVFDSSASKKNVFSVHVTYRCSGDTDIRASFLTNGYRGLNPSSNREYRNYDSFSFLPSEEENSEGNSYYDNGFKNTGGRWRKVVLKPQTSSEAKGIYSFQFQLHNTSTSTRQPNDFAINDIAIVYRSKGTHFEKS